MAKATVEVRGARELRRSLKAAGVGLEDLKDAHAAVSSMVATASSANAPHKSGRLAGSVRGNRAKTQAVVRAGGAAVPYAGPIHWGWPARNIAAQPFIADTAKATEPRWVEIYTTAVTRIVDKVRGA